MKNELETLSDEDLLGRFVAGSEEAFSVLVRRHEDRLFALALRMTGERADAFDAVQDTFVHAFRRASSFRGESAFGTWLYRIGINTCKDLLRKRQRLPQPEEDLAEQSAGPGLEPGIDDAVSRRIDVARALQALPPEYREAVALHDLTGAPYHEIAAITEVSIGTVKSRISRGRRRLAQLLEHPEAPATSKDVT
jgi:RNA polymerase sigma-70 factor (ECF subfamily)